MAVARVVVRALEVALLRDRPVDEACLEQIAHYLAAELAQVREPLVDHARLRLEAEVVHRELPEAPRAVAVRATPDLEDERLAALARERAEVISEVLEEL